MSKLIWCEIDPICTWVDQPDKARKKEELEGMMQFYMESYLRNCAVGPELFEEKTPEPKQQET